jgi:hypothetical protein
MPVDLITRPYRSGDEADILDLFARSFPHAPRPVEHFRWKYRESPYGNERISLTYAGGALAGHYSGYPVPFRASGRDYLAHHIGDTMTDVAFRHIGRGPSSILGRTALHFYENFCEGKIAFNYGFNVSNIQKFSLRFLRSERVEPVTYRVARPLPPIRRYERWLRGYSLELVHKTTGEWDSLFERSATAYRFCVRRNAAYVRWRYLSAPDVAYHVVAVRKWRRLVGWVVYRIRENRLILGDLFFHPDFADGLEVALRHVVPLQPVETIEGWFPPRPRWLDTVLVSLGFETHPEPQELSVMCVPFTWPDVVARMREDLFYTWGDSDLF